MTDMWINLGPQHPMNHGLWNLKVRVDGEMVVEAIPQLGYLHRGVEKLCERRDYNQIIPLMDRLCYVSSLTWAHAYVLSVEDMMELEIPERAKYLRVIGLELQRITSHLMWLAAFAPDLGLFSAYLYAMREREYILDLLQWLTGARMNQNYPRIGGVRNDMPDNFPERCVKKLDHLERKLVEYKQLFDDNKLFQMRTQGVGILSKEDAMDLGVTGPLLRGSNCPIDMRTHDPYEVYDELDWEVQVEKDCDVWARFQVRMGEIRESCRIIRDALKKMPSGPVRLKAPKRPTGQGFRRTEDSRGEALIYVIADGEKSPYRVKIRSPIFAIMRAIPEMVVDNPIADLLSIMGSIDVCIGDTDK
ncbi:MAG: NADH-quinone oxidoreductase subunit D [Thermoplasmata archaeon]|nr:NADH-quinone oxidoreductase subunit D [Thermoplasmata archaeon]